jgi:hypothetical protein
VPKADTLSNPQHNVKFARSVNTNIKPMIDSQIASYAPVGTLFPTAKMKRSMKCKGIALNVHWANLVIQVHNIAHNAPLVAAHLSTKPTM